MHSVRVVQTQWVDEGLSFKIRVDLTFYAGKGLVLTSVTARSTSFLCDMYTLPPPSSSYYIFVNGGQTQTEESLSTCRFAQRVSTIKNDAKVNEDVDPGVLIRKLRSNCAALTDEVAFLKVKKSLRQGRHHWICYCTIVRSPLIFPFLSRVLL